MLKPDMKKFWRIGLLVMSLVPVSLTGQASQTLEPLIDPAHFGGNSWSHKRFVDETSYSKAIVEGITAIRAIGNISSSVVYKDTAWEPSSHPIVEWSWRVETLQPDADIRDTAADDFAAAIMVVFEANLISTSQILIYAWTNDAVSVDTVVPSPRNPDRIKTIVVRSGTERLGSWVTERRNLVADYQRAFGTQLSSSVAVIGLCTDNDQTAQPVEAYYGTLQVFSE